MPLEIGTVLNGRYRIERVLGQGGFGAVYLATDQDLGLPCAVKENLNTSPQAERQFRREAGLLASLRHANLPRVTDHFILGDEQYLVMDFIEGDDLRERLEQNGPLAEADVLRWGLQLCDALVYLHSLTPPVIHRDIKPANIKITLAGEPVLVDFGIAKAAEAGQKTTTGAAALTSGYAPPEQYQLGNTDGRTDEYALAATLYHLLTGQIPPDSVERLIGQATLTPPEQLRPDLAPHVAAALRRALEIRPDARFPGVANFRNALRDPDFRYAGPAPDQEATLPRETPAAEATAAAPTRESAPATQVRARWSWRGALAGLSLALFSIVIAAYLALGLAWVLVGPFQLNNRLLAYLGTPTARPLQAAQITPATPFPTSTPFQSPTPIPATLTPTATASPTAPPTLTPTPAAQVIGVNTAAGWRLLNHWRPGDGAVLAALSPDGQTVAAYQPALQGIEVLDLTTGASVAQLKNAIIEQKTGKPLALGYLKDTVLVLFRDQIQQWSLADNRVQATLTFFQPPARGELRVSPDLNWVAVRSQYLTVYNLQTRRLYQVGDQGSQQAFAFSPDGRYLALAVDANVDLYRLSDGQIERRLAGRNKPVLGLTFTADSARVVASSGDIWEVATGNAESTFDSASQVWAVAVSPNSQIVVGSDGNVWELATGQKVGQVPGLSLSFSGGQVAFTQDGRYLCSQAAGQELQVWTTDPNAAVNAQAVGTPAVAATPARDPIALLNVSRLQPLDVIGGVAAGMVVSPAGKRLATWSGATVTVYDLATRAQVANFNAGAALDDLAFLDEDIVLAATKASVERWDLRDGTLKQDYRDFKGNRIVANATAGLFAVQGKYIQIVDVKTGKQPIPNLGSADSDQPFAFTPDGQFLAIAAKSNVSLWELQRGTQAPGPFGGHGPTITGLAFTPDGKRLVAASGDVWDVATRQRTAAFDLAAATAAVSADGQLIVGGDGSLWDANTGQYLGRLAASARRLAFTPDDRTLVWQAGDGKVQIYGIAPVAAHVRPPATTAAAPDLLPLTAENVVSASVLGWWGTDTVLQLRLITDTAQPRAQTLGDGYNAITLSPDGRTFTGLSAAGIDQVDAATGALVDRYQLFLNPETILGAAYLGHDLLILKDKVGVERWDLDQQTLTQRYNVQGHDLVASADGQWFAVQQGNDVQVVDAAKGTVALRVAAQAGAQAYQFTPDSRTLAVAAGLFVELWDVGTGKRTATLRGHGLRAYGLAFTPDGQRLVAASGDIWNLAGGQAALKFDTAATRGAVSPDGALFVGDDGSVWATATGQRVGTLPDVRAPADTLRFTADGRQLLWRVADGRLYTWGVRPPAATPAAVFGAGAITVDNGPLFKNLSHLGRGRLLDAVWSPDDRYLAVNTTVNTVIYDGATLQRRQAFLGARALTFDAQGRVLVGGADRPLQLLDVASGAIVKDYQRTGVLAAAFSPDGQRLALGGRVVAGGGSDGLDVIDPDGVVRTFDKGAGRYPIYTRLEFTADGRRLVASFPGVNVTGSILIWDVENGKLVRSAIRGNTLPAALEGSGKFLTYLAGTRFVVESLDQGGQLFTINADGTPFLTQSIDIPTKFPLSYAYTKDGRLLVFYSETSRRGGGVGSSAYLWRIGPTSVEGASVQFNNLIRLSDVTGAYAAEYARDRDQHTPTFGLSPANTRFYSLTGDGVVRVWDYPGGGERAHSETDWLPLMALSPDGQTVAVPNALGQIEIHALADGALSSVIAPPTGAGWFPTALAYDSASLLLVLQPNGTLSLVDVNTGRVVEAYTGGQYASAPYFDHSADGRWLALWDRTHVQSVLNVFSLAPDQARLSLGVFPAASNLRFDPSGRRLAVVRNKTVEVWDLQTRAVVRTLTAAGRSLGALAFSPDGTRLYSASGEIWDLADGHLIATFESKASDLRVSPNGKVLVGVDGTLWNAADGALTGALAGVPAAVANFDFTPDGARLVWQDSAGVIQVWGLAP